MKLSFQPVVIAAFALWLGGCATSSVKQTWKSPAYKGEPPRKLAVLCVADRPGIREGFENRFVNQLHDRGQDAVRTLGVLGLPEIKADKEAAAVRLRATGADAILIVRLVDRATYNQEMRATPELWVPVTTGIGGYGWYDYYSVAYMSMGVVWGNSTEDLFLDSSLFDLNSGQRLWSAQTLTELKEDANRLTVADSLIAKIVDAMRKDGLIRPH